MRDLSSRSQVLGCGFNTCTIEELVGGIHIAIAEKHTCRIATVNVTILVEMQRNIQLREAIQSAHIIVADGQPIVWVSKVMKPQIPERIAGVDLVEHLADYSARFQKSIFLLGATDEVANKAAKVLMEKYAGLHIAGWHHGYFPEARDAEVVRLINCSNADILLVGMGVPRQELFLHQHAATLKPLVRLGVGGSFDVIAGKRKRAPKWMQHLGLEWAFRFAQEPGRLWRRYLISDILFLWYCIRMLFKKNKQLQG